jgi:general secretion pathway protein K
MALVLVLWVIALLTVMALGLTTTQRSESNLSLNQLAGARFRTAVDAVLHLVVLNLISVPVEPVGAEDILVPDGSRRTFTFDGDRLEVMLFNEGSRINLNAASREQLAALIEIAQGPANVDESVRDHLADAIVDWRDSDDLTQLNGAEDDDYTSAGLPYGARDEPFQSVEELLQVLGMTRALYRRLAPDLTVGGQASASGPPRTTSSIGSGRGRGSASGVMDFRFASAAVLAAMQELSLEEAQQIIEERSQSVVPNGQLIGTLDRGGPLYRLHIVALDGEVKTRSEELLFELRSTSIPPFEILWRRSGNAHDSEVER